MKKKIVFYIGSLARGGAERVVVNISEYLQKEGYTITIVTKEKETEEYEVPQGVNRILGDICGGEITNSRIKNFFNRVNKLKAIWKQEKPDLIVSFIKKNNLMAILSSRGLGIPVLVAIRSAAFREYPGIYRYIARILFGMANGIIVQTSEQADYFGKKISRKAFKLPNPIHPDFIGETFCDERDNEIVTAGRIDDNKNQIMLVEAFACIANKFPQIKVIIYGDGSAKERVKEKIKEKNLEDQVVLAGHQTDIKTKIKRARMYVLTSRVEGMPNAMIEAMALGLVPISTDFGGGGAKELIKDGENGYLIPVDDVEALADCLERVLSNPELEQKLREGAIAIGEQFNPEVVNVQWKTYFERFIQ